MYSQTQYNLWELEFIKCGDSSKKLQNYIDKYKHNTENPFVYKAKEALIVNKNAKAKGFKIESLEDIDSTSIIMVLGFIGFIALGCFVSDNWRGWLKSDTTPSNIHINVPIITIESSPAPDPTPSPTPNPYPNPAPSPNPQPSLYTLPTPEPAIDNNRWEELYRSQYAEMERQAERDYNSLTNLGYRYKNNGTPNGYTGRNEPHVASQISAFRQLQHRMRDLRFEASKQGVNISQSYWEEANVNL